MKATNGKWSSVLDKEELSQRLKSIKEKDYRLNQQEGMPVKVDLKKAVDVLSEKLKRDKEMRFVWKENIAFAFNLKRAEYKKRTGKQQISDEDSKIIANEAAEYFMSQLVGDMEMPKDH